MKSIQSAVQQWAIDNKKGETDAAPSLATLTGSGAYINGTTDSIAGPSGGACTFATVAAAPACDKMSTAYPHTVTGQ